MRRGSDRYGDSPSHKALTQAYFPNHRTSQWTLRFRVQRSRRRSEEGVLNPLIIRHQRSVSSHSLRVGA